MYTLKWKLHMISISMFSDLTKISKTWRFVDIIWILIPYIEIYSSVIFWNINRKRLNMATLKDVLTLCQLSMSTVFQEVYGS